MWNLLAQLTRDTGTRVAAAIAGWARPFSTTDFMLGSLYSIKVGKPHPLMPELKASQSAEVDLVFADRALAAMNGR